MRADERSRGEHEQREEREPLQARLGEDVAVLKAQSWPGRSTMRTATVS
jgi:hypothetical protein